MTQSKDSIYACPLAEIEAFKFDAKVAAVFPDMTQRSVPGYQMIISALENVLIPETFKAHQSRLLEAGFSSAEVWVQYFNFASILALK